MAYICNECVSEDYSVIPGFIIKNWNFKKFQISKKAKELIAQWYNKPIIHIKTKDHLIKLSPAFHKAILLKRKIHKIFDLMKCDNADQFALNIIGEYKHLVLRENLFSIRDLVNIQENKMNVILTEFLLKFEDHILKECDVILYILILGM